MNRLSAEAFAGVTKQAKADVIAGIDRKVGAKEAVWANAVGSGERSHRVYARALRRAMWAGTRA